MDKITFEKYLEERYLKQMDYYKLGSAKNQKKYKRFQWFLIILSALTPVFAALSTLGSNLTASTEIYIKILVVVTSSIVAILTTGLKTFNYQELWTKYRSTYEKLKPEIHYYDFNVGPYAVMDIDKESIFVARVEAILDGEHTLWHPVKNQN